MKDQRMFPQLASNLLFDTDQDNLFGVDEIYHGVTWASARVYQSVREGDSRYEVWLYEWHPDSNEEKSCFVQYFQSFEDAKIFALELSKDKNKVYGQ